MDTRPRTSLISFCTVQLRTLSAAHFLATLCLFTTSGPDPGELSDFWGSMVFRHPPSLGRGRVNNKRISTNILCTSDNFSRGIFPWRVVGADNKFHNLPIHPPITAPVRTTSYHLTPFFTKIFIIYQFYTTKCFTHEGNSEHF